MIFLYKLSYQYEMLETGIMCISVTRNQKPESNHSCTLSNFRDLIFYLFVEKDMIVKVFLEFFVFFSDVKNEFEIKHGNLT